MRLGLAPAPLMSAMWLQKPFSVVVKNPDWSQAARIYIPALPHSSYGFSSRLLNPLYASIFALHKIGLRVAAISGDFSED